MIAEHENIFQYEFFFPWKGFPSNYNTEPLYLPFDLTLSGNIFTFSVLPNFEEPYWIYRVNARYDDGTGTPLFGTNPGIELNYIDWSPPQQGSIKLDAQLSPGEGNQFFYALPYNLYFGGGKHGFDVTIRDFGSYTHLAIVFIGRIQYNEPDI